MAVELTASKLALLQNTSQDPTIRYLQNLAIYACSAYEAVLEHGEKPGSPHYLLALDLCEKVHQVVSVHQPYPTEVRTPMGGEFMTSCLRVQQMGFRDAAEDIHRFIQKRYKKNLLVRMGRSMLGIDSRAIRKLAARLREGYDQLQ
ncbi:hypothetical protein Moror_11071, partial [Moniliophthora roreri MCA 2997]